MVESSLLPRDRVRKMPPLSELGRDLTRLTQMQRIFVIALPFLCVATYSLFASLGWWPAAILAVAGYTFFSYGSTSHDLVHGNLGLPRWLNNILLASVELLGLRSGHAYRAAHLHHHVRFPQRDDVEAAAAHGSWWAAILCAPLHQPRIWCWAMQQAKRDHAWIVAEGIGCAGFLIGAMIAWPITPVPVIYAALVIAGSWTFPLITSYLPHDPNGEDQLSQTRRFRGKVASILFGQHLYHLEHHLYPRVPRHNWPELARRLDPYLDSAGVKPVFFGL